MWKQVNGKEIGLGWDIQKKTIDAFDEWWQSKLQVHIYNDNNINITCCIVVNFNIFISFCRFILMQQNFAKKELTQK